MSTDHAVVVQQEARLPFQAGGGGASPSHGSTLFTFDDPDLVSEFDGVVVRTINHETAKRVIEDNHYLKRLGSTSVAYGMFLENVLAGVLTLGTIPAGNAAGICGKEHAGRVRELTRLYLYDWAGPNAESCFMGRVFRAVAPYAESQGGLILLSYADTAAGHVGTIYQASNWIYTGASTSTQVMVDGSLVHMRVASDSRKGLSIAGLERVATSPKHRYVRFLGNRKQKRDLRKALAWPVLPYPKKMGEGES